MDPLSVTASIIAALQLSAKVLAYLNDVKDASKDRTLCAIETSNMYRLLFNLRDRVEEGDFEKPWYTAVRALAVENGPLDQFKQALETLQTMLTDGGRLKKVGEALMWKFKKEEVASILGRMERLKSLVEIALQMDHFKLSQAIKDDTNFVRTHVPAIQSGVDKIQQGQDHAKHRRLVEWISPTDYPAQQSDIINRRQEGTCQWFLDAPEFAGWLSGSKQRLFCPGIPGAGKTMVAAIAIDHLLKTVQNSSIGVAYVYCNYKAQEEQGTTSLLAAILKQLVQARPSIVEPVERLHKQHAGRGTMPSLDEVFSALRDVLAHYPTVYIVTDALDECRDGTRRQFLAKLRELQAVRDLRLMATSRFIPEIIDEFGEALSLEVQASKEDVKRFVAGQTYRLPKCIQRDLALQDMVQDKIVEVAGGMFLLARLHTDSLLDKRTPKEVKSTLARFSNGSAALDGAYGDALQRIEGQLDGDYERAKKVLSWITFAKRPLTTAEVCCALAVEPDEAELDLENIPDVEDLVSVCAGLVVVDQESAVIRLVHYTTQQYFERIKDAWNPAAQLHIATTCLTYLSFSAFRSGGCSTDREFEERLRRSAFLDYAAKHWGQHTLAVQEETPLFLAVEHGHYEMAKLLLDKGAKVNAQGKKYGNALQAASYRGDEQMVKLLLNKGADVNAQGGLYGNALQAASDRGHEQLLKLLLDNAANVNTQGDYDNALQAASYRGDEQVVRLLLNKGADVNAQGGYYGNALQAALDRGHKQVVKLLLDNGADVNLQGKDYGNALYAALYKGDERTVKLPLDKGADVNAQGSYGNALHIASYQGHEQIMKLLLDKGADVDAQGFYGGALRAAAYGGHEQIVQLLLDKGADINAQGPYGNALHAASYQGHEQIVKLLLDKGADVNAQGRYYGNALRAALDKGHEQIVKLLLDKGANDAFNKTSLL
ncbi:hypothetical protein DL769_003449 [Monosporascus sp. CRB-8-3]|nr:hypothetical protein DL769_003449 [Monosporascus sp. CRB-8-3]